MRLTFEKLLLFLIMGRLLILTAPWLTTTLLFPEKPALNFSEFTAISWDRWDAPHYIYLAEHGYTNLGDEGNFIVFFPLYPLILGAFIFVLGNPGLTGIFVSTILFLAGAYFFYKLVKLDYSEKIARLAVISVAIFPTTYFFNAPYTESLFFLLFCLAYYSARKENWILAGVFSGLATVSRPPGFLVLIAILIEWFYSNRRNIKHLPILIFPSAVAGLAYLYLNKLIYGNPFEFQKILNVHWQKHLMSPFISIQDSWRIAFSGGLTNFVILVGWAEALTITISWILIPFAFKYLRKSYAIFYTLSIILFSSTSFILSTPRYLLSIPPFFILLALAQKNYLFRIIFQFTSVVLLISLSILFTRGQWAF